MLGIAAAKPGLPGVTFARPISGRCRLKRSRFDAVVCGFGMMFPADKIAAYRELRRVTRAGGRLLFTVWDRIGDNPLRHLADSAPATSSRTLPASSARTPWLSRSRPDRGRAAGSGL